MTTAMYICVLDEVPDFMTPTLVGHAVLNHHLTYTKDKSYGQDVNLYYEWLINSYKKRVCKVNSKEFDKIAALDGVVLTHENSTLGGKKSCATVVVSDDIRPNVLKFAKLWKPNE